MDPQDKIKQEQVEKRLKLAVSCGHKVKQTLESPGWKEVLGPILDKMISDIVGSKNDRGEWMAGLLSKAQKEEKREYYVGYKQFGIDFHNRALNFVRQGENATEKLKVLDAYRRQKPVQPMMDSPYAPKEGKFDGRSPKRRNALRRRKAKS